MTISTYQHILEQYQEEKELDNIKQQFSQFNRQDEIDCIHFFDDKLSLGEEKSELTNYFIERLINLEAGDKKSLSFLITRYDRCYKWNRFILKHVQSSARSEEVIHLLLKETSTEYHLNSILRTIEKLKLSTFTPVLTELIKDPNLNEYVKYEVFNALVSIGTKNEFPILIDYLKDGPALNLVFFYQGERLAQLTTDEELIQLLKQDPTHWFKTTLFNTLSYTKTPKALEYLISEIEKPQKYQYYLFDTLAFMKMDESEGKLIEYLNDNDKELSEKAAYALRYSQSERSLQALIDSCKFLNEIRTEHVRSLLHHKHLTPAGKNIVIEALNHSDSNLRSNVTLAIGNQKQYDFLPQLCELIYDTDESVRFSTYSALVQLQSKQSIPILLEALNHEEDSKNIEVIIKALSQLNDKRIIKPFLKLLEQRHPQKEQILSALIQFGVTDHITAEYLVDYFPLKYLESFDYLKKHQLFLLTDNNGLGLFNMEMQKLQALGKGILTYTLSSDSNKLAAADYDNIMVWNTSDWNCETYPIPKQFESELCGVNVFEVNALCFDSTNQSLYLSNKYGLLMALNLSSKESTVIFDKALDIDRETLLALSSNNELIYAANNRVFKVQDGELELLCVLEKDKIIDLKCFSTNNHIVFGGYGNSLHILNIDSKELKAIPISKGIDKIAISLCEQYIAICTGLGHYDVYIYHLNSDEVSWLGKSVGFTHGLAFDEKSEFLYIAKMNELLKFRNSFQISQC